MSQKETLREAIANKRIVEFSYRGETRRVEPYVLWRDRSGVLQLDGWSVGFSESESNPPWRNYNLSKIGKDLIATKDVFDGRRAGYNPKSKKYRRSVSQV